MKQLQTDGFFADLSRSTKEFHSYADSEFFSLNPVAAKCY